MQRRGFLLSAGAVIGLPILESLTPHLGSRARAQTASNKKAVFLMFPIGNLRGSWHPVGFGSGYQLPPALSALAPYRQNVSIVRGLEQPDYQGFGPNSPAALRLAGTIPGGHHFLSASYLTCNIPRLDGPVTNTESIDNRLARLAGQTRATYLSADEAGIYDEGYSKEYLINFSWTGDGAKNTRYDTPRQLFEALFGTCIATTPPRYVRRFASILDGATADIADLQGRLAKDDKDKLDRHLTSLREVERNLQNTSDLACQHPEYRTEPTAFVDFTKTMLDIIVLGLATGRSNVYSYLMDREISQREFRWIGITTGHHSLSHDASGRVHTEEIGAIATWYVSQFAYLLGRLQAEDLLDDTMVMLGSEFSNAAPTNAHGTDDLPVLLAGGSTHGFVNGHGIDARGVPLANLYLTMIRKFGGNDASFGKANPDPNVYYYDGSRITPDPLSTGTIASL